MKVHRNRRVFLGGVGFMGVSSWQCRSWRRKYVHAFAGAANALATGGSMGRTPGRPRRWFFGGGTICTSTWAAASYAQTRSVEGSVDPPVFQVTLHRGPRQPNRCRLPSAPVMSGSRRAAVRRRKQRDRPLASGLVDAHSATTTKGECLADGVRVPCLSAWAGIPPACRSKFTRL